MQNPAANSQVHPGGATQDVMTLVEEAGCRTGDAEELHPETAGARPKVHAGGLQAEELSRWVPSSPSDSLRAETPLARLVEVDRLARHSSRKTEMIIAGMSTYSKNQPIRRRSILACRHPSPLPSTHAHLEAPFPPPGVPRGD
ncbi:uncharacterized protein EMH_0099510 [Eimeria mitis]|uniref:Uncharacterized protein n=1 Tax=Eimeria mitis TaxID=44415 RepID=U6KHB2_9EIME|nr:uncharacterized protein EMH_0099510 [Eimeria mitis]CDJ35667.1 hypothetical protein EMH_0099510 [Eimeria mitis]